MYVNLPGDQPFYIRYAKDAHPMQEDFLLHAHSHYEILIFISGDITYLVEGNVYTPRPWDILLFNIAETHKVLLHSDTPYERLVIQMQKDFLSERFSPNALFSFFHTDAPGRNHLLHPSDFRDDLWKLCALRLMESTCADDMAAPLLLPALLHELRHAYTHRKSTEESVPLATQIVHYVNSHITEDLSPSRLTQIFLISRTALYTLFQRATGTGIHDYINVKRLILAQELLRQGEKPTHVYEKVGFRDYTAFFRAYRKTFGHSPRQDTGVR